MTGMFLTKDELATLTGRKTKSKQIEALRKMHIPFFVNANDAPVVARVTVEGKKESPRVKQWVMPD
jgi:hypothetical protein